MTDPRARMSTHLRSPMACAAPWRAASGPLVLLAWAPAPAGSGGYVPVGAGPDVSGGELLLVLAYVAIWLVAFALIALSLRRQSQLDARIAELAGKLAQPTPPPQNDGQERPSAR